MQDVNKCNSPKTEILKWNLQNNRQVAA